MMRSHIFNRYRIVILLLALLGLLPIARGAIDALATNSNRPEDWLPERFQETKDLAWFSQQFVSDDVLILSWDGCHLDDPRQAELTELLQQPVDIAGQRQIRLFRYVTSGNDLVKQLTDNPLSLKRSQAIARLNGWIVGAPKAAGDPVISSVVLMLTAEGWQLRDAMLAHVRETTKRVVGLPSDQIHIAGSTYDGVAIDEASQKNMEWYTIVCYAIGCVVLYLSFRSIAISAFVFMNAVYCQMLSLALISFAGSTMDSVMLMVPSLVFVLSISTGVHLVNIYRDVVASEGLQGAPSKAIRHAFAPCWLSSLTTSLGLISLVTSFLLPIQKFGLFAAVGVVLGTGILFLLFPCQLELWSPRRWAAKLATGAGEDQGFAFQGVVDRIARWSPAILLITAVTMAAGIAGITRLQSTARVHDLFSPGAKILQDYEWFETQIGPLTPVEIVLRIPKSSIEASTSRTPMLDRMNMVRKVQHAAMQVDGIGGTVSAVNFSPGYPDTFRSGTRGIGQIAQRIVLERRFESLREMYREMQYFQDNPQEELWRISARVPTSEEIDLERIGRELKAAIAEVIDERAGDQDIRSVVCGSMPLIQKSQEQLLDDMARSFITAFALIAVAMMVTMRSVVAGLLAMISNVFPAVLLFGLLGWLGVKVEIGSMMTITAAMGIAVDDTLHFVTWFRRGASSGLTKHDALVYAYRHCSRAMLQTSLICGLGLLVYALSPFAPISRFAWLMSSMLATALVGDLVVLPAIISSRMGNAFLPRR
ncbi:MMPL family protein [Rosistilla oblonga]|uniref:efflux RND transporter permease subunit n=1 Tax=Rosistilla oblonga TaxID=2527990 RepID=UPI00118B5625|nr:MMPL family transporter [Rosistilla oblonga]QDV11155.1 MMPL family protein [Rosistilla oblonga]